MFKVTYLWCYSDENILTSNYLQSRIIFNYLEIKNNLKVLYRDTAKIPAIIQDEAPCTIVKDCCKALHLTCCGGSGYFSGVELFISFMTKAISCRNQSMNLRHKSLDWFLFDRDFRYERVNYN